MKATKIVSHSITFLSFVVANFIPIIIAVAIILMGFVLLVNPKGSIPDGNGVDMSEYQGEYGDLGDLYTEVGLKSGVRRGFLDAIHNIETSGSTKSDSVSFTGARGPMQFQPSTWTGKNKTYAEQVGYIYHEPGKPAVEARIRQWPGKNPEKYSKYKFEEVVDWDRLLLATSGRGRDFDGDGKADPRNLKDAVYASGMMLADSIKSFKSNYKCSNEIAEFLAAYCYNAGSIPKDKCVLIIRFLNEVESNFSTVAVMPLARTSANEKKMISELKALQKRFDIKLDSGDGALEYAWRAVNMTKYYEDNFNLIYSQGSSGTKLPWPTLSKKITSYYGRRKSPDSDNQEFHNGLDIGVSEGTELYSVVSGAVYLAGKVPGGSAYGLSVVVTDGNKCYLYAHLSKTLVTKGQTIQQGQAIALSGGRPGNPDSGRSTGPHLHFGVSIGPIFSGRWVNPLDVLQ